MEKKTNKILWVLLVIIIPLLFAASLSVIVFSLLGVNVIDKAKGYMNTVPVVSEWIEDEKPAVGTDEDLAVSMKEKIATLQQQVEDAESAVIRKDDELKKQQNDIARLKEQLEAKSTENEQAESSFNKITEVYGAMAPKDAATIFENMKQGEAAQIITNLEPDVQASILAEMDPKTAAEMTKLLTD